MPNATFGGFPFDEELFSYYWGQTKDPVLTAFVDSGVLSNDAYVAGLISNGSDYYTKPYYGLLSGNEENYDGQTDITTDTLTGDSESGIVYGRAHAFLANDFTRDFNSGANPMQAIAGGVMRFISHKRQARLLGIAKAVLDLTAMKSHNVSVDSPINEATIQDVLTDIYGDMNNQIGLAVMHSKVARALEKIDLLNYKKYTDPNGITSNIQLATLSNGIDVVVDDCVPTTPAVEGSGSTDPVAATYTTLLFAKGAFSYAKAPVDHPIETTRNPLTKGGQDVLIYRYRETIHPNGFSFKKPSSGYTSSPTDTQLATKANWELKSDPKVTPIACVTTQV